LAQFLYFLSVISVYLALGFGKIRMRGYLSAHCDLRNSQPMVEILDATWLTRNMPKSHKMSKL